MEAGSGAADGNGPTAVILPLRPSRAGGEYGVLCIQEYRKSSKVEPSSQNSFMGLKDHLGHDLGHLYVESIDPQISASVPWPVVEKPTMDAVNSEKEEKEVSEENVSSGGSEESTDSDHESEQLSSISVEPGLLTKTHRQLCRSPCLEPHLLKRNEILQDFKPEESHTLPKEVKKPPDVVREYQTKLEFALKLGYSEEQVQLVLNKLGTDALINDILGELVKLGNKSEADQTAGAVNSIMRETASLESQRSESPMQEIVTDDGENLRPVVIDGSNVAMSHGNKEVFSCRGIKLAVDWFLERGHKDITVFVPAWRKEQSRPDALITDQEILRKLEKEKILVFTPSRRVQGRRVVCYDDRFIVKLAFESDGIIVSNDNYRDLAVDIGYYSMLNAYSNLSISGPRSPERRFSLDTDYRVSSVASDCSSEGSMSCGSSDSYVGYNDRSYVSSPDPQISEDWKMDLGSVADSGVSDVIPAGSLQTLTSLSVKDKF